MGMDDPWGSSPWADEIEHPITATRARVDTGGSDAGLKTPVRASNLGPEPKADSPWNDGDDGFGDWAAMPVLGEGTRKELGFDGAGDEWEHPETADGVISPRKNGLNGSSWTDNLHVQEDTISRSGSTLMPVSRGTVRQPSPDPWATETTFNHEKNESSPQLETSEQISDDKEGQGDDGLLGAITEPLQENLGETLHDFLLEPEPAVDSVRVTNGGEVEHLRINEQIPETERAKTDVEVVESHDAGHDFSRPSSSPSDQSHHDEILPDSPRTSLDEEPKRPKASHKVSSNIQDLVEHFDGLTGQEEEVMIKASQSRNHSATPLVEKSKVYEDYENPQADSLKDEPEDDEFGDFGDFEDGQSETEDLTEEKWERPVTPIPTQTEPVSSPASNITGSQDSSPRNRQVRKTFGRIKFAVDNSILERFCSLSNKDIPQDTPGEKTFIMDTIPNDSFQNLEERKTWYRVSRYGSMRKHNSGNDDNYIRVSWPQSQIREQTLTTVGRWMEEDRISGRVVLGGGSKGSSIFGWNDKITPAIPLTSAFGTRQGRQSAPLGPTPDAAAGIPTEQLKGLTRARSRSKTRSPPEARRSFANSRSTSESHKGSSQALTMNFGWNASPEILGQTATTLDKELSEAVTTAPKVPASSRQPKSLDSSRIASSSAPTLEAAPPKLSSGLDEVPQSKPLKSTLDAILPADPPLVTDADDDWGEMVASPASPVALESPYLQPLRQNTSQSFDGANSLQYESHIESPIYLNSTQSQETTISIDVALASKPRSSLDSMSDPLPLSAFPPSASSLSPVTQFSPSPVVPAMTKRDPWASADFSLFDSPETVSMPAPLPEPVAVAGPKPVPKPISTAKAPPVPSPLRYGKTRQEVEQEEIVASIVKGLPDLSYMLRR